MGTQLKKLKRLFTYLDTEGSAQRTASVEVVLGSGEAITVRAGGPGVHSGPSCSPYENYEVLMDHEPERHWSRFTDQVGMVFAHVPALVVAHHMVRHGGIEQMAFQSKLRRSTVFLDVQLEVPEEYQDLLDRLVVELQDARLVSAHLVTR